MLALGNTESTAEHTFALLLALARRVPESHASVARGEWDRKRFAEYVLFYIFL